MQMNSSQDIPASPEMVWASLLNSEVLKACVPGCQEMNGTPEDGFDATVVQKVGPVKATFKGHVDLSDMVPYESLTITGDGKGGAAGFAKGVAKVTLAPSETGTLLSYDVDAKIGGKLAQLGSRIIDGFAKKMADQFFTKFSETFASDEDEQAVSETQTGDAGADEKSEGWLKRLVKK